MKKIKIILMAALFSITCGCVSMIDRGAKDNASVVVVGMENSKWAGACPGAQIDSDKMYSYFKKRFKNVVLLQNNSATKSSVAAALNNAAQSEYMIFYYSGHGGSQKFGNTGKEEVDGCDEFICLWDTYLKDNEIWNIISKVNGRVFLIFDCCHSETMFRSKGFTMSMLENSAVSLKSGMSMLCWSGCADDTFSYGGGSGGEFTKSFLRHKGNFSTYGSLWKSISKDKTLLNYETPKQTKIGNGFESRIVPY